jgi:hypothetical protein
MVWRSEIPDEAWEQIALLLPENGRRTVERPPHGRERRPVEAQDRRALALGRSRGGLTTKLHLACDGKGRPLSVLVKPGQ